MFKGISEDNTPNAGRKVLPGSAKMGAHQFLLGEDYNKDYMQPISKTDYLPAVAKYEKVIKYGNASQVAIDMGHGQTFHSDSMANYQHPPKNYQKTKPALNREEATRTNYALGNSAVEYNTSSLTGFNLKKEEYKGPEPKFTPPQDRLNPVSGELIDKDAHANIFEGFHEKAYKGRITQNYSYLAPENQIIDPITGRQIPKTIG